MHSMRNLSLIPSMMKEEPVQKDPTSSAKPEKKPGFFGAIFQKLDDRMKQKAEEKVAAGSCCSGKDSKGKKCC